MTDDYSSFSDGDWVLLLGVADQLDAAADRGQDCLSTLCTLSGVGNWTVIDGQDVYSAPCDAETRQRVAERDGVLVETHTPGDTTIPTRVAMRFGLGETIICGYSGNILQGDDLIGRPVFETQQDNSGKTVLCATTVQEIVSKDGDPDEDGYYKPLKWSHLQTIVDSSGSQSERFNLLAAILRCFGDAKLDSETFIPFGVQFSDTDFIDSF